MKNTRLKFRSKMLLWIIGAVVIISGGIQFYISWDMSNVVLSSEKNTIRNRVASVRDEINAQLRNDKMLAGVMAGSKEFVDAVQGGDKALATKLGVHLKNLVEQNSKFDIIALIDKNGQAVAASSSAAVGVNVKDREYFKKSIGGEAYITDPIENRASGNLIFGVSVPVKEGNSVVGVLFIGNKMSDIYDRYVKKATAGKTGYTFILSSTGLVVAHPNPELVMNEEFIKKPGVAATNKMFFDALKNDGEARYWWESINDHKIAEVTKTDNDWLIILSVPEKELLASLDRVYILFFIAGIALIIAISIVVIVLIGSVDKVLKTLDKLMSNLAVGRVNAGEDSLQLQNALKRRDEFGDITRTVVGLQKYLRHISYVANRIADKHLDVSIEARGSDDELGNSIKAMVGNFNDALAQVRLSARQVSQGAEQVSSASQDLSHGAVEQAATIEKVTESINTLNEQTNENATNAATANEHAVQANKAATLGQTQMQELSKAMDTMSGRASEVQQIIKTIDDIAFQTNLLALNAAVEAARAGSHGKGFAVVAEEVRNLAARSAKAAGETASLIENVVTEIDHGNNMSKVTAESLNNIVGGISQTRELIGGIATSTSLQSKSMQEIGEALELIEKVTQSNSANSEETASASEEMSSMSVELDRLISSFVLQTANIKHDTKRPVHKKLASPSNKVNDHTWGMNEEPVKNAGLVRPRDVIKLDDEDFGKF